MQKKRLGVLAALGALVLMIAAVPMALTTVPVRVLGPFYTTPVVFDSATGKQLGCHVQYYLAADSVRMFQIVAITSARSVKPSATLTDYNKVAGVAVGGTRTSMQASYVQADSNTLLATANQRVVVCDVGRTWVMDSAAAIGPGLLVGPSLGASLGLEGRLKASPAIIDSFYRSIGRTVDTVLAGTAGLVNVNIK